MKLVNRGVKLTDERRYVWGRMGSRCHNHVICFQFECASRDEKSVTIECQFVYLSIEQHRKLEARNIALQIVSHLVFGGEAIRGRGFWEWHPWQVVETGWGEESQRVPTLAPAVPSTSVRIENYEIPLLLEQVISHR